jgi:hypothetical protein
MNMETRLEQLIGVARMTGLAAKDRALRAAARAERLIDVVRITSLAAKDRASHAAARAERLIDVVRITSLAAKDRASHAAARAGRLIDIVRVIGLPWAGFFGVLAIAFALAIPHDSWSLLAVALLGVLAYDICLTIALAVRKARDEVKDRISSQYGKLLRDDEEDLRDDEDDLLDDAEQVPDEKHVRDHRSRA